MLILRLDERRLESDPEALRSEGAPLPVGPTPARLLFYLASNRSRVVATEELLREVWGGAHVTPASVQQAVRTLRVALDGDGEAFIRTVRGQGYQLGPRVEVTEDGWGAHELPFVGRAPQLGRLADAIESARAGRGRLVLVAGAPGMGKTRLLQELEALAPRRGFRFLCGRCPEQSGAAALWPWEEILRGVLEGERGALETAARSDLALLQGTFSALGQEADVGPAFHLGSARFRLYEAVRRVLVACARGRPLVVAIDDLHRADETSVHLLEWVAARNAGERIVLVAASRDGPVQQDEVLRSAIASLLRLPGSGAERLARLTRDEVEEAVRFALGGNVAAEDVEALWLRSAGNPFFLKTLVHGFRVGGPRAGAALFPEANEAVRQHLAEVTPGTQDLLRHAAVLGREIDVERLCKLAGGSREEVSEAIEEAGAAGLVERGPNAELRFVHALVVESLHESFDAGTRAALHARATEIFEDEARGDASSLGALAEHAWQAVSRIGAARAAAHCERAAQAAARRYAFEEAVRLHARALELSRDAEPRQRLRLLLALGESQALGGQAMAASETLGRAVELAKATGDDEAQARAVLILAVMRGDEIQVAEAGWIRSLEEAIEAHRAETPLRARLLSRLAAAVWRLPPAQRARDLARESVRLARQCGDPDALSSALTRAFRILQTGAGDEAARAEMAYELGLALERAREPLVSLNARVTLLWQTLLVGDRPGFDEQVDRVVQQAESAGAAQADWYALVARTSRALLRGELGVAEELARRSLAVGEASGVQVARNHHVLQLFAIRWAQDRLDELELDLAEFAERPFYPWSWRAARSVAGLAAGRVGPARELLRAFCADPDQVPRDVVHADVMYLLGEVASQLSDGDAAQMLVARLEALRGRHYLAGGSYCHIGAHERQLGRALGVLERWDEAEAALESALASDRRLGAVAAVARDQHDLGALLLRRGRSADRARARTLLEEARVLAHAFGIARLERACEERLLAGGG